MATTQLSRRAEDDLVEIGSYSLQGWGHARTLRYIDELEDACQRLAGLPMTGRLCEHVRPGLRRVEQGRHGIFYRLNEDGILLLRILHERMLPERHELDDEG